MKAHIYAFGSICRGEVTPESDVDLLAVTEGVDQRFDPEIYSVYSYTRVGEIWREGTPFAWHLASEARLLFSPDGTDYLHELGAPARYQSAARDCQKFFVLFEMAANALRIGTNSPVFELSTIFLAVRNFATCYSLRTEFADFSRHSALRLGANSLLLSKEGFEILERARLLCTRGLGGMISHEEITFVTAMLETIDDWMRNLLIMVNES